MQQNKHRSAKAAEKAAAAAMKRTQARAFDAAPDIDTIRYSHELEPIAQQSGESNSAEPLYMLVLHIQANYLDIRLPLVGPMVKSVAEQQQAIRCNQMADAMIWKTPAGAQGDSRKSNQ
jgi:hypothetical protein